MKLEIAPVGAPGAGRLAVALLLASCGAEPDPGPVAMIDPTVPTPCPPEEPFGLDLGQAVPNVALEDCDGTPVDLQQAVCASRASYFFVYAEW